MTDFGSAVSWVADMTPEGGVVTGNLVVAQAIARRLMTPRGRLIGYPNYGYDLTQFCNGDIGDSDVPSIQSGIEAECLKDPRVASAVSSVSLDPSGLMTVKVTATSANGPFTLVLSVSQVTVQLLKVTN